MSGLRGGELQSGETANFADVGWPRSGAELPKGCLRVGLVARGHRPGDRMSRCLANRSRPPSEGRYGFCRAGWAPRSIRPPYDPSGVPPAQPQRGAARVQTPGSCLFATTANGRIRQRARRSSRRQALGRYWGCGQSGEGQTDPGNQVTAKFRSHRGPFPTTNPFGPRTAEPVGSVNLSPDRSQRDGQTAPVKGTSPHRPYRL